MNRFAAPNTKAGGAHIQGLLHCAELDLSFIRGVMVLLASTLLLSGLYWLLHTHGAFLGQGLLAWAKLLAVGIDPALGQLP